MKEHETTPKNLTTNPSNKQNENKSKQGTNQNKQAQRLREEIPFPRSQSTKIAAREKETNNYLYLGSSRVRDPLLWELNLTLFFLFPFLGCGVSPPIPIQ